MWALRSFLCVNEPLAQMSEELLGRVSEIQQRRSLLLVNELATRCFDQCIEDLAFTKGLRAAEASCVDNCAKKYLQFSLLAGEKWGMMMFQDDNTRR